MQKDGYSTVMNSHTEDIKSFIQIDSDVERHKKKWDSNTQPSACETNALAHCATAAVKVELNGLVFSRRYKDYGVEGIKKKCTESQNGGSKIFSHHHQVCLCIKVIPTTKHLSYFLSTI
uniref:Uncharacterized protein LOC111114525 n=1 Tax=Crassostrea virginica TaxID=6565 RepID=A0A8B8BYU8_CRAVI|nr:uncharacterized protein LOC111114525 [Crassostrea virginica]